MEKYGLVLEGGGVRGAYTAGALAWLSDHHVTFDYGVGISSGAMYMTCYWQQQTKMAYDIAIHYATNPENVGLQSLLHCGYYVDYGRLFDTCLLGQAHYSVMNLKAEKAPIEIGAYSLEKGKTVYFNAQDLDENLTVIRATVALPIASAIVKIDGSPYLDGGITKMIPIERSLEQGVTKHLVITTKPADYVRKPANRLVIFLMRLFYRSFPQIVCDYKARHLNYKKQVDLVEKLVQEGKAMNIRPSRTISISRFKGSPKNCEELYQLGYADMEARRLELETFLGRTINN